MDIIQILAVALPLLCHIVLAGFMIVKIAQSIVLIQKQKQLNIILVVLIPFIWSVFAYYMIKKEPGLYERKNIISNGIIEDMTGA